jgi:photosystem II stability/assembly factor-like uncharacterized protein
MPKSAIFAVALSILISILWSGVSGGAASAAAQTAAWVRQNFSYDNTFYAVDFVDANVGTIVGTGGIILHTADGGATWVKQESGTTATLYGVALLNELKGLAVGDNGTIRWTEDGGATWSSKTSGTTYTLMSAFITDASTAIVAGRNQIALRTTDGGATWIPGTCSCMGSCFSAVSFADANVGIGVGQNMTALSSLNGGVTWTHRNVWYGDGCSSADFDGIACIDADTAFAVGYINDSCNQNYHGRIWRTIDGGDSWASVYSGLNESYRSVSFADRNTGIAVGKGGKILRTTDGGLTWAKRTSGVNVDLRGVCFADANTGTAVGAAGVILRTTDGGATWVNQTNAVTNSALNTVYLWDSSAGIVAGEMSEMARTGDGGASWHIGGVGNSTLYPPDLAFNGESTGIAVGFTMNPYLSGYEPYARIFRTTDAGVTWTQLSYGLWARLSGCSFPTPSTALAVGESENGTGFMEKSTDGGITWVHQTIPVDQAKNVFFTDALNGTVVGRREIIRTMDGGVNWTSQYSGANDLSDLWFTDANTGTVVGAGGTILRTTDGGATWTPQTSGTTNTLNGVCFTDANTGTVVGSAGTILRTMNGGANWTPQASGTTNSLYGVHFIDQQTGTVVGAGGMILRTASGGEPVAVLLRRWAAAWAGDHALITWELMREALASEPIFEVSRSADRGASFAPIAAPEIRLDGKEYSLRDYAVEPGSRYVYRVVIRENTASIASFEVEVEIPTPSLALAQNHPNPFNPTTTIDFTLPTESAVTIDIYDSAGRLVRRVLEARVPAGQYEASWDGRNAAGTEVASGVYFCRLAAGKETISRKMVLLR